MLLLGFHKRGGVFIKGCIILSCNAKLFKNVIYNKNRNTIKIYRRHSLNNHCHSAYSGYLSVSVSSGGTSVDTDALLSELETCVGCLAALKVKSNKVRRFISALRSDTGKTKRIFHFRWLDDAAFVRCVLIGAN